MSGPGPQLDGIAVIGYSGRFPGARNVEEFWHNLRNGVESIRRFSDDELKALGIGRDIYGHPHYVKAGSVIEGVDLFDAEFFGYSPREAQLTDPQQRIFLECAWEALEQAGCDPERYEGLIGVFAGCGPNRYLNGLIQNPDPSRVTDAFQIEIGNEKDYIATRVAYKLNLRGPSLTVQTACSTSLVAVHLACQNLLTYQCDMALAGGVTLNPRQRGGYFHEEGMIPSPDGHCRAFDAKANGTVIGEGAGIVVLKRHAEAVADGDRIHAVIRGSAINNDGSLKVGFTAPSVTGQADVIAMAQGLSDVTADRISYVETHGTGTSLGDPIEIAALTQAFRKTTDKKGYCAIGSVKTNVGHLDAAAGVTGLLKTILMLEHREIVPSLHFETPNPNIDFENSPFFVNTRLQKWESNGSPRIAGVSAFGIGGTNAHVIIEEAPETETSGPSREKQLLLLSARTPQALDRMGADLAGHLRRNPGLNLSDVAYTLQKGRREFAHRRVVVCRSSEEAADSLEKLTPGKVFTSREGSVHRDVVFLFSGQASEYVNMGRELYQREPLYREGIDRCAEILRPLLLLDLRDILYPDPRNSEAAENLLSRQSLTQTALFSVEYALARLWTAWGIRPTALVGHSIGEYTAACLSGVFSLENALSLVAARGRLMEELSDGSMCAVFLPEEQLRPLLSPQLSIALVNGPSLCVVSGETEAVRHMTNRLSDQGIEHRRLRTTHAFHSPMTEPILDRYAAALERVSFGAPDIPFVSNVTGTWAQADEVRKPDYWVRHLRETVRFSDGVKELLKRNHRVFLEVGPGSTLSTLILQQSGQESDPVVLSSLRHAREQKSDDGFILETLGRLWLSGVRVDWSRFCNGENRHRIALPTYPFERKRHWVEATAESIVQGLVKSPSIAGSSDPVSSKTRTGEIGSSTERCDVTSRDAVEKTLIDLWQDLLGVSPIDRTHDFFELGGHSLIAIRMFTRIEKIFGKRLPLATLFASPTVAGLADLLVRDDFAPSWSSLVKIRSEGSRPPFFCIHSEGGNVLEYQKLAKYMDADQPFYGLQAKGLEGDHIVSLSVEEMAREYCKDIKRIQPKGPYYLGGYCLGGMVAYEMAGQLEAEGEKVGFLALLSTCTPHHLSREIPKLTRVRSLWYNLLERCELEMNNLSVLTTSERLSYVLDRARRVSLYAKVTGERWMERLSIGARLGDRRHTRRYILEQTRLEQAKAFYDFQPKPIRTGVTLIRTSRQPRSLEKDPTLGWADFAMGGIVDFEIDAFHKNILKDPNVRELAIRLQACLDETQRRAVEQESHR